jgi:hypothetical protein
MPAEARDELRLLFCERPELIGVVQPGEARHGARPAAERRSVMRQRLYNLITVVSLVLCIAALTAWLRSVHHYDRIDYTRVDRSQRFHRTWIVTSNAGQCTFGRVIFALNQPAANPHPGWEVQSSARSTSPLLMWPPYRASAFSTEFSFASRTPTGMSVFGTAGSFTDWQEVFPHWVAVVLFLVVPAIRCTRWLRRRRAERAGHCPRCGYDLRATPDRCPECGASRSDTAAA